MTNFHTTLHKRTQKKMNLFNKRFHYREVPGKRKDFQILFPNRIKEREQKNTAKKLFSKRQIQTNLSIKTQTIRDPNNFAVPFLKKGLLDGTFTRFWFDFYGRFLGGLPFEVGDIFGGLCSIERRGRGVNRKRNLISFDVPLKQVTSLQSINDSPIWMF